MTIRRHTDPINIKRIWNAIRQANHQKVSPDLARITKYLQSIFNYSPTQVELHIKQALDDKLIVPVKSANPNQTYKVPLQDELTATDGKDWYCFECHLAGDVIECQTCFRVFHQGCLMGAGKKFEHHKNMMNFSTEILKVSKTTAAHEPLTIDEDVVNTSNNSTDSIQIDTSTSNSLNIVDQKRLSYDDKLCSICNIKRVDTTEDMDKSDINYLLKFVLRRIRAWLPITITDTLATEDTPDWLSESEITWRANQLFFEHTDMSVIEVKLNTETYITFTEFLADALTIHHNVAIFHGIESQEYGAAEFMVRDALHDISEIRNCVDCYKHSNEKLIPKWFCLPCRVPHELVWAKQKGYPFWPAKVIRITESHYDVRFFGGKYERSLLQKMFVRPIDTPKDTLMIKPSTAFTRAYDELKFHQKLLKNANEVEKLLSESKNKRKSLPKNSPKPATNKLPPKSPIKTPNNKIEKKNKPAIPQMNDSQEAGVSSSPSSIGKRQSEDCIALEVDDKRRKLSTDNVANSTYSGTNVIDISDGEEEDDSEEYSFRQNDTLSLEESYEQVTSSTENYGKFMSPRSESGMQPLDQPYSDSVEKMRRTLERLPNKKEIIKCAMDCMQTEIDKIMNDHNEHLKRLFESHNQQISETKKKQWCYNCEQDAIYHCCWNTAYCSQTCQQQHWQAEHKKVCRRKR